VTFLKAEIGNVESRKQQIKIQNRENLRSTVKSADAKRKNLSSA